MAYSITKTCIQCSICTPQCPTGAIKVVEDEYWIDPTECDRCEGVALEPQCVANCPVESPIPLQAKKGRCKKQERPMLSLDLFLNGKSNTFASAIVVWELCNVLTQNQSLPWQTDDDGYYVYQRQVNQGRGLVSFWITESLDPDDDVSLLDPQKAEQAIANLDIRSACLHLIYAAHATSIEAPWENEIVISDRQIESYLGLDKRKDLSKLEKLRLIKELAQQPCSMVGSIQWPRRGKVPEFAVDKDRIWRLNDVQQHFEEDELGCRHLVGLTFHIQAGEWSRHFLNQHGYWDHSAFYQYGHLPSTILPEVMSNWQQHEGAMRMLLWLLFKTKMGHDQRITAQTLMRVAYGDDRLRRAFAQSSLQKRLIKTFEGDLETLHYHGVNPVFDPETYPPDIQPLWAKILDLPDDAEAALDFWIEDGSRDQRMTDSAPRGKWRRLLNARFLRFDLPETWEVKPSRPKAKKRQSRESRRRSGSAHPSMASFSGSQILAARKELRMSQRQLAEEMGKSQSWIRDVEKGRFQPSVNDQFMLREILKIDSAVG
ncbi:MAG: helix-turn-helix domain-containing protein [Elainellaceae cyanobacterium]